MSIAQHYQATDLRYVWTTDSGVDGSDSLLPKQGLHEILQAFWTCKL